MPTVAKEPEYGGHRFLRNVGPHQDYMALLSQKIATFITILVRTSDPTQLFYSFFAPAWR
jgi:hypothetical protein